MPAMASLIFAWLTAKAPFDSQSRGASPAPRHAIVRQASAADEAAIPLRLRIPAIRVLAEIESVGKTDNGSMATPRLANNAGWYSPGIRPGETGSAVIAGHLDDERGRPAIFAELHALKRGDIVYVRDGLGTERAFFVRGAREYGLDENADAVFARSDSRSLNLITCSGPWDAKNKHYAKRLVVFAELME